MIIAIQIILAIQVVISLYSTCAHMDKIEAFGDFVALWSIFSIFAWASLSAIYFLGSVG